MHVSYEKFVEAFGGNPLMPKDLDPAIATKARDAYNEIALLCGGESVRPGGSNHFGGMSLTGVLDADDPSFSELEKTRIAELIAPLGVLDADNLIFSEEETARIKELTAPLGKKAASAPNAPAAKDGDK